MVRAIKDKGTTNAAGKARSIDNAVRAEML
jgi:hypothetical protein